MHKGSLFSTSSPTLSISCLSDDNHSDRCEVISHCIFNLHSPDDQWCWAPFHVPSLYLLGKTSIQILCRFLKSEYLLSCYTVVRILYVFCILSSYQIHGCKYFIPFCLFIWLISSFTVLKFAIVHLIFKHCTWLSCAFSLLKQKVILIFVCSHDMDPLEETMPDILQDVPPFDFVCYFFMISFRSV